MNTDTNQPAASNSYEAQASDFLNRNGIKCRISLSNSKAPSWGDDGRDGERNHYRVTLSRGNRGALMSSRLTFDFWGSISDAEKGKDPSAYDVLACISSDVNCPDTFADFCGDYDYEADSIKALQTFRLCNSFAKRLSAFFSPAEVEQLSEIQ